MTNEHTYDPEDLERLLREKSFSELLPDEKAFVLQFVDNDLEYDSMRDTLHSLGKLPGLEPAIQPTPALKADLMEAFKEKHHSASTVYIPAEPEEKVGFWAWFWNTNKAIFMRPAFQMACLVFLAMAGYYVATFQPQAQMAEAKTAEKKEESKDTKEKSKSGSNSVEQAETREKPEANSPVEKENTKLVEKEEILEITEEQPKVQNEMTTLEMDDESNLEIIPDLADELGEAETDLLEDLYVIPEAAMDGTKVDMTEEIAEAEIQLKDAEETLENNLTAEPQTLSEISVIYTDESAIGVYDARSATGNSIEPGVDLDVMKRETTDSKRDFKLSESENAPLLADDFSHLLGKLYTAE